MESLHGADRIMGTMSRIDLLASLHNYYRAVLVL